MNIWTYLLIGFVWAVAIHLFAVYRWNLKKTWGKWIVISGDRVWEEWTLVQKIARIGIQVIFHTALWFILIFWVPIRRLMGKKVSLRYFS